METILFETVTITLLISGMILTLKKLLRSTEYSLIISVIKIANSGLSFSIFETQIVKVLTYVGNCSIIVIMLVEICGITIAKNT